ncbi:16S rRNA (adenine(1518)-N(6)/adenine(1519)-N(6))-dimethyltransferase RsmA [Blattabacterium cuenoti]|uniref:16S rRNA (adenine(1518)-N(6)/adenine(1519)-N(6))- dimethyltransferase RsmA n=1 Tax=Blattabacterium cuenoti TaxID=1653831 RepID=UPI00163B99F8|nr:16S rRNA (adenine(1518)-N(6)/adenine(1519)-N(6))-dimethyltransferase RsmA [Blattabacterium cuenoti]
MRNFFIKKKFDQYFLQDKNLAKKIVNLLSLKNYDTVVEIGPGLGSLTHFLLQQTGINVILIEIDNKLIFYLKKKFSLSKYQIINKNFLKWNPEEYSLKKFAIIGNFPYKISSKILFHILKYHQYIPECIGMFQKEFVDRIISKCGNKSYGRLSVLIQIFYKIEYLFSVNNQVFYPITNVKSAVISLKTKNIQYNNIDLLLKCVKIAFNHRRKILKNSLQHFVKNAKLKELPFINKRAEELTANEFMQLIKKLSIGGI